MRSRWYVLGISAIVCTVGAPPVTATPPDPLAERIRLLEEADASLGAERPGDTLLFDGKTTRRIPRADVLKGAAQNNDLQLATGRAELGPAMHGPGVTPPEHVDPKLPPEPPGPPRDDGPGRHERSSSAIPRAVIGSDNRYQITYGIYSYSHNTFVDISWPTTDGLLCSGLFYGANWIVTAGHCVLNNNGSWNWPLKISRGRAGSSFPYGSCDSIYVALDTYTPGGSTGTDYAAIKVANCSFPPVAYGSSIEPLVADSRSAPRTGWVTGYPATVPFGGGSHTMWEAYGNIWPGSSTTWWYYIDQTSGQSGGPVILSCAAFGWSECVIGVNSGTQYGAGGVYNDGKRFVSSNIASLAYWRDNL